MWKELRIQCWGEPDRFWYGIRINSGISQEVKAGTMPAQEVGDGHITVDRKDNITFRQERAISLEMLNL